MAFGAGRPLVDKKKRGVIERVVCVSCCMEDVFGTFMEMRALKAEMFPISLKEAQIYCEDHRGRGGKRQAEGRRFKGKIADLLCK